MGATTKCFIRGYKLDPAKILSALDIDGHDAQNYMRMAEVVYNRIREADGHTVMQLSLPEAPETECYFIFVLDDAHVKQVLLDKPLPPTPPILDRLMFLLSGPVVCEAA